MSCHHYSFAFVWLVACGDGGMSGMPVGGSGTGGQPNATVTGGTIGTGGAGSSAAATGGSGGVGAGVGGPGTGGGAISGSGGAGMGGAGGSAGTGAAGTPWPPASGTQGAICDEFDVTPGDAGLICYRLVLAGSVAMDYGYCTIPCASDADCDVVDTSSVDYTCNLNSGAALCRLACNGQDDVTSCPEGMRCATAGVETEFRCIWPEPPNQ